jgi:hypothetical protein
MTEFMLQNESAKLSLGPIAANRPSLARCWHIRRVWSLRIDEYVIWRNRRSTGGRVVQIQKSLLSSVQGLRPLATIEVAAALTLERI